MTTDLAKILTAAARGAFPPADGGVTVLPPASPRDHGVLSFTGCAYVCADVSPAWVRDRLPPGDLGAPLSPAFLAALADRTGRHVENVDLLTVAEPLPGPPPLPLREAEGADHPRVARALRHRDGVRAWITEGGDGAGAAGAGTMVTGRGVAGRREIAFEVAESARGRGLGRRLAVAARHLSPPGEPVWAQVAPANAASVRALLAAGFVPVGAEALLTRAPF
ncbi:GNAT family N-acetyltransferase [Streptomyces sp. Ru73]|uniref:GNAT family N-acetyltransferase n=1 Tax=Streptomyces sp. Ru73 TaxID=2080748 RepID=UPI000CDD430B|nr:GNAT family N-acetyltransferase [Streptomyces sp. Ru73]POX38158.1 GNAT family N-acetyltransferase [Streptomyces sp. Ru73]